jgi:hypothetical protein
MLDDAAQALGNSRRRRIAEGRGIALDVVRGAKELVAPVLGEAVGRLISVTIQSLNSLARPASACSARPTGSSMSFSSTRRRTVRSGLGCVMI